ncbi:MAG: hypothetical protein AUJ47_13305 [Candidatus Marinimicrobia bacterium CG1_02_48_14]|nr:MAG: hypothetical protein AUJ47_13305 [Candidatus Marinimicrobia bacterium CG1_02_48_14]
MLVVQWFVFFGCAEPVPSKYDFTLPPIDQIGTLEVVTWNVRYFPENGNDEVARVTMILDSLNADIVCLQEIDQMTQMERVAAALPQYDLIKSIRTDFLMLGILYKPSLLMPLDTAELFPNNGYDFASRYPLQVKFSALVDSVVFNFTLINMHLKAMGDASSIQRRHNSTTLLHEYLLSTIEGGVDTNFIVVGDWNDDLSTTSGAVSFEAFMDDTAHFKYTTWDLSWATSNVNDSYPKWPSFLDNILISRALFDENQTAVTQTLRLDAYMSDYFALVSDHRPVLYRFSPKIN